MSRSYKKHPWVTDHHVKTSQEMKRFANKKARNTNLPNKGSAYKKVFESWDICDFKWHTSWQESKEAYLNGELGNYIYEHYPTLKSYYRYWYKCHKMK